MKKKQFLSHQKRHPEEPKYNITVKVQQQQAILKERLHKKQDENY